MIQRASGRTAGCSAADRSEWREREDQLEALGGAPLPGQRPNQERAHRLAAESSRQPGRCGRSATRSLSLSSTFRPRRAHRDLWGVKTRVASRGITICRQNADFETPHATPCRHPERTLASGRGVLEIEARGWLYPNRIVGSTGWVRQVHNPQPCYRVSDSAPRGVSVFVGGRGFLKAHA
jgi:hypothetical protein